MGKCGVSIVSLADMERLFDGISLGDITTSMTINSPAPMIFAMYLVVAEQQGADWKTLSGTIQNDILKEFIAQKEYIFPPRPSMRLITDIFAVLREGRPEVEHDLGERVSHSRSGLDGAAGTRVHAARRHRIRPVGHRRGPRRRRLRAAHFVLLQCALGFLRRDREVPGRAQDLGASHAGPVRREGRALAEAPLPHADRRRVAHRAAAVQQRGPHGACRRSAAVLGGTNSLHTNSLDEALALPTAEAATLALRTQQVIAHESGVTNVVDPLGGSYFVERLTLDMEEGAYKYFDAIDRMGGMVAAIEAGLPAA